VSEQPIRILVLCTGNSARSQMAEGLFRELGGDKVDVQSAGTQPAAQVNPFAIQAMAKRGIEISSQFPKMVDPMLSQRFDYVITVCDQANESCPIFPGRVERIHWSFADPATVPGSYEDKLAAFRTTRDGLEGNIRAFLAL
jgi:arsenate reductase (thioredoxin)